MKTVSVYMAAGDGRSSDALLHMAASLHAGFDLSGAAVSRLPGEKPFFPAHPALHFSVSHSGSFWVCAFASLEIGCDIQICRDNPRWERLARRWFHPDETAVCASLPAFYTIWSRKEAFVKALGIGIDRRFPQFSTVQQPVCLGTQALYLTDFTLPGADGKYTASIACPEPVQVLCRAIGAD